MCIRDRHKTFATPHGGGGPGAGAVGCKDFLRKYMPGPLVVEKEMCIRDRLPEERTAPLRLPHVSENELTRHYTALCKRVHGVNDGLARNSVV